MAGDTTVPCTTKLRLFAKRRRWEVAMHVHHPSDARLLCRVDNSRRNHQTCDGAAAAMSNTARSAGDQGRDGPKLGGPLPNTEMTPLCLR